MTFFMFFTMAITIIIMGIAYADANTKLKSRRESKGDGIKKLKTDATGKYPVAVRTAFLNYNELPFYEALMTFLPAEVIVCPKISLLNVLTVNPGSGWKEEDVATLADKKVDFLICDASTMKPMIAIEIGLTAVNEMEEFKEKLCRDAGLRFLRYPTKDRYTKEDISSLLDNHFPKKEKVASFDSL